MIHLNITFPEELKERLDKEAVREKIKRSTFIQKAVRVYLDLKARKVTQDLLREGYQEMTRESDIMINEFKSIDQESLKYVN